MPPFHASAGRAKAAAMVEHVKTYEGCVEKFRNDLAIEMEWGDFKESLREFDKRIDPEHHKLVDRYCRMAHLDKHFADNDIRKMELK